MNVAPFGLATISTNNTEYDAVMANAIQFRYTLATRAAISKCSEIRRLSYVLLSGVVGLRE